MYKSGRDGTIDINIFVNVTHTNIPDTENPHFIIWMVDDVSVILMGHNYDSKFLFIRHSPFTIQYCK